MATLAALQACACGTRVALGLLRCPRCQRITPMFADRVKEEEMPRITVAAGPTNAAAVEGEVGFIKGAEHKAEEVVAEAEAEVRAATDWASKTVAHLRKAAEERGLDTAGPKADLAARLAEHDAKASAAEAAPAEGSAPEAASAEIAETTAKASGAV